MASRPRSEIIDETEVGFYHCTSRCVRRSYLCGNDAYTGQNYDHRKDWIEDRMKLLASVMAVELAAFAILENHLHMVLRNRPDVVSDWRDEDVARRWLRLCPGQRNLDDPPPEPTKEQVDLLLQDQKQLAKIREKLSSISWFHKLLKEYISRRANAEDDCTGAFWEGRFKSTRLLDFYAVLMCSMYVDLNWIRAQMADTPETSRYTSAFVRIAARQTGDLTTAAWLAPVDESCRPSDANLGLRATDDGFLPLTLDDYLRCLDWCGRQLRQDKRGRIPEHLAPILERLELDSERCLVGVRHFGRLFVSAAGTRKTLQEHAARQGHHWYLGMDSSTLSQMPPSAA